MAYVGTGNPAAVTSAPRTNAHRVSRGSHIVVRQKSRAVVVPLGDDVDPGNDALGSVFSKALKGAKKSVAKAVKQTTNVVKTVAKPALTVSAAVGVPGAGAVKLAFDAGTKRAATVRKAVNGKVTAVKQVIAPIAAATSPRPPIVVDAPAPIPDAPLVATVTATPATPLTSAQPAKPVVVRRKKTTVDKATGVAKRVVGAGTAAKKAANKAADDIRALTAKAEAAAAKAEAAAASGDASGSQAAQDLAERFAAAARTVAASGRAAADTLDVAGGAVSGATSGAVAGAGAVVAQQATRDAAGGVVDWITENPLLAAGAAIGVVAVVRGGGSHRSWR